MGNQYVEGLHWWNYPKNGSRMIEVSVFSRLGNPPALLPRIILQEKKHKLCCQRNAQVTTEGIIGKTNSMKVDSRSTAGQQPIAVWWAWVGWVRYRNAYQVEPIHSMCPKLGFGRWRLSSHEIVLHEAVSHVRRYAVFKVPLWTGGSNSNYFKA